LDVECNALFGCSKRAFLCSRTSICFSRQCFCSEASVPEKEPTARTVMAANLHGFLQAGRGRGSRRV